MSLIGSIINIKEKYKPKQSGYLIYNLIIDKYKMISKNYSAGIKVPVSISRDPLPYLSDRDFAI